MESISWDVVESALEIQAKPEGLWTVAIEALGGVTKLRIRATGKWSYSQDAAAECGPDGDRTSYLPAAKGINPKAPIGALIGKIGGSTADVEGTRNFVVGSHYVFEAAPGEILAGSLYLTINDLGSGYLDNSGRLTTKIEVSYQTPPAS
jgi:hypothetical protein